MRKLFLFFSFLSMSTFSQEQITLDIGAGPTMGTSKYSSQFAGSLTGSYYFDMEGSIQVGGSLGVIYFNAKENFTAKSFAPFAASIKFHSASDRVLLRTDVGYGLFLGENMSDESGLYFKPYIGYQLNPVVSLGVSYSVVLSKAEPAFVGANLTFNLSKESRAYSAF